LEANAALGLDLIAPCSKLFSRICNVNVNRWLGGMYDFAILHVAGRHRLAAG
jgi:hypothetical protein